MPTPRSIAFLFVACLAVALVACSDTTPLTSPDLPGEARAAILDDSNPVVQWVTGNGHFPGTPLLPRERTTTFTIRKHADGTVTGWYKVEGRGPGGGHVFITFDCLHVNGNQAWASGTYVRSANPDHIGRGYTLRVVDHGQGGNAPPDAIGSNRFEALDCSTEPDIPLRSVPRGNLQVRGG